MEKKIEALMATLNEMERMKKSVFEETDKDIDDLRWERFQEMNSWLTEMAATLQGRPFCTSIKEFVLKDDRFDDYYLRLNWKPKNEKEKVSWFIANAEHGYRTSSKYWEYLDGEYTKEMYSEDYHKAVYDEIIENWPKIREYVEVKIAEKIREWMDERIAETQKRTESYLAVKSVE